MQLLFGNTILNFYDTPADDRHGILLSGTDLYAGYYNGSYTGSVIPNIAVNTWYHIVLVNDGGSVTTYLNGIPDTDGAISQLGIDNVIGFSSPNGGYFEGNIDDVKVFDYALTASQVAYEFNLV